MKATLLLIALALFPVGTFAQVTYSDIARAANGASADISFTSLICAACNIENTLNLVADDPMAYADVTMPIAALVTSEVTVTFPADQPGGEYAGFVVARWAWLADADLLGLVEIETQEPNGLGGWRAVESRSGGALLSLAVLPGGTECAVEFETTQPFRRVVLRRRAAASLAGPTADAFRIHFAYAAPNSASGGTPLPVEMTRFEGVASGTQAHLSWSTASERNNAGFTVEHRVPEAEAFAEAGFVVGEGTTDQAQQYRFTLGDLAPGTHRFRLRQVDFDGTTALSSEVEVTILADGLVAAVYPNPVAAGAPLLVALATPSGEAESVRLYDVLGRVVAARDVAAGPSAGALALPTAGLAPGRYLVRVQTATERATHVVTVR